MFPDVFRRYEKATPGCNGLISWKFGSWETLKYDGLLSDAKTSHLNFFPYFFWKWSLQELLFQRTMSKWIADKICRSNSLVFLLFIRHLVAKPLNTYEFLFLFSFLVGNICFTTPFVFIGWFQHFPFITFAVFFRYVLFHWNNKNFSLLDKGDQVSY